jgi:pilus assembly protein CpaC
MIAAHPDSRSRTLRLLALSLLLLPAAVGAQGPTTAPEASTAPIAIAPIAIAPTIQKVDLPIGRSYAISTTVDVIRVSVAADAIADVIAISPRELVVNAKALGETDLLLWGADGTRAHYRVLVHSPADRMQVLVSVKFAEVRRDVLTEFGLSGLYRRGETRIGTGVLRDGRQVDPTTGAVSVPADARFLTLLSSFGTADFMALLQAQEEQGKVRTLAEPNIMAGNKEDASFLAGGEIPVPIAQNAVPGQVAAVTIQYREFGIRLAFNGEIVSDSLIRLKITPEVSTLDYANAVVLSGFRIPALRTRRVESTLDVKRDQSLVISGLFNDERQQVRSGIPGLKDLPILGALFSSRSWQRNETELVVVVTPVVVDPMRPRDRDILRIPADTALPAASVIRPPDPTTLPPGGRD